MHLIAGLESATEEKIAENWKYRGVSDDDKAPNLYELPQVLDLFSGCGGLSYGFLKAGFPLLGSVDINAQAIGVCETNHPCGNGVHRCADITKYPFYEGHGTSQRENLPSRALGSFLKTMIPPRELMIIGGPPCQAYSQAGRGKLNSLGPDRHHLNDSRGGLFEYFINIAHHQNAACVIMENVPGAINYGGKNIPDIICQDLAENGYKAEWTLLNAADFGVPQIRERVFIMAMRNDLGISPKWPVPSHSPPDGYTTNFGSAVRLYESFLKKSEFFSPPRKWEEAKNKWVSVNEALSDLPSLRHKAVQTYRTYPISMELDYRSAPINSYQRGMRMNVNEVGTTGHSYRNTSRDFQIFERMLPNDNYPAASRIADQILEETCKRMNISEEKDPMLYSAMKKKIVPPYDRMKFLDKWTRLDPYRPSRTVVAHLSVDTYSHIHPFEPRGISVREAARLQSFPDNFHFWGSLGDAFAQIGNAVPPLLGARLAEVVAKQFGREGETPK
jgi:DNA (cytosine-5)-methyltransferase 1